MKKFNLFLLALFSVVLSVPLSAYGEDTALITSVDQLSSTATKSGDYGVDNLIDGDTGSYWRTHDDSELGASYFQVELPYSCGSLYFVFTRRSSSSDNCITEWGVYGVPADKPDAGKEDCVLLSYQYTPFGSRGETLTSDVFDSQGYTTLRFYVENTNTPNEGYTHVAEFQLYEVVTYAHNDDGGLILSVDQLSSPYSKQSINEGNEYEGDLASLIDNDPNTYWHLENSSSYPGYTSELGVQYLQVELLNSYGMLQVVFTRRNGYADYQITKMSVYAVPSEDAEKADCIYLGDLDLPFTAVGETLTAVFDSQGYTTLRFYIEETTTGSTSTHIAEFQLYEYTDMNLAGRTITVAQTADASMKPGQWYVVLNRWQHQANNFMRDPGVGANLIMSDGTDVVYSGMDATAAAQYMVRFVSADAESADLHPKYYMQYGTGNYMSVSGDYFPSVSIQELADPVYVYNADVYGGEYYVTISTTDDDSRLDNYGAGGFVIKGDSGEADDASYLDDVYFLFPVSVSYDRSEFKTEDGGLITSVDQLSSPYTRENTSSHDYSLASMIDGDTSTYWCSETSGTPMGTQYFQVELPFSCDWLYFVFTRRSSNDIDCITEWGVYGVPADKPDAEKADCVQLAYLYTPHGSKGETLTSDVFDSQGYTTLRFYIENTTDPEDGYTHIAEFQLYEFSDVSNKKIASISDAITTQPEAGKWYLIMNNRGGTMTPAGDTGAGESITRASSANAVTAGMAAEGVAGYLLSFFPTGESSSAGVGDVCTLRWATGNYWASIYGYSDGTAITTTSDASAAGVYNVYPTVTGGSTFGLNAYDMEKKVDNNGVGAILTAWDSGQNTATSGNNVWWLYEVELADMNAEDLQLAALIEEAEADYALYDGKLDTGFSEGDGVGNGLIKSTSQFSSPYTDPTEGSLSNLLDNNNSTYWHSTWHDGDVAHGTHYLQVNMADDFNGGDVVLNLIRRNSNNNHVTAMSVKDGEDVEIVSTFDIPFSGSGATEQVNITIPAGYKTLRFYEQATTTSDEGFWHVGDFQLFDASYLHPDYNNTNPDVANQLTAAIAAANEAMAGTVSQADIDALQAAIDYYLENISHFSSDDEYGIGDVVTAPNHVDYTIKGINLFWNGGFDNGVDGWKTIGYETPANLSNFTYYTEGGFNGGAYINTTSEGVGSETTIRQSVKVEEGKNYLFIGYTSGTTPDSDNYKYNGLFNMKDSVTEDGSAYIEMNWGADQKATTSEWTQTMAVFTATYPYVGIRFGWDDSANIDGFQLYEVELADDMPIEDNEYLLVNTETGYYLGGGLTWGTKATMLAKPQFFALEGQATGTYTLDSHQYNNATSHYLGDASGKLYVDAAAAEWTLEDAGDGNFTIYCADLGGYLTGAEKTQTEPTTSEEVTDLALWTLVTRDDVIASMDNVAVGTSVDVTALIASPELKRNSNTDYYPTWTVTGYGVDSAPSNCSFGSGSATANCAESYMSTNGFDVRQTLTDLKAGTYTLSAQAFYNPYTETGYNAPVLYADDVTAEFPQISTSSASMAAAYQDFLEGTYPVSLEFTVDNDNDPVTIGFKGDATGLWNIFGELGLEYHAEPIYALVHECVAEIDHWTTTGNNGTHELNDCSEETDESGMVVPFCQNWVWEGDDKSVTLTSATISHNELTGLEEGTYIVSLDIRIFSESGADITSGTTLSANDASVDLVAAGTAATYGDAKEVYGTYTLTCNVGSAGTLDISMYIPEGVSYNWIAWKNLAVYHETDVAPELTPVTGMMNVDIAATQDAAMAAYTEVTSAKNYYAAVEAIAAAEASVEYYAGITAVVSGLDEAGTAAWEASSDGEAYAALTLNGEDISASLMEACKAQTTAGADLTYVMTATSWTGQTGTYADGVGRYDDYEIKVEDEPVKVLYQSITGMLAGTYEVSFYGVANNAWVGAAVGEGIAQAFANDQTEDIEVYDQTACTPTDYPHTFATVEVGLDGVLEYGLQNIATGGNWYVCQAISLTLVKLSDIYELIAQYNADVAEATKVIASLEEKIEAATADIGYDSTILAYMESSLAALQDVMDTYGNIDTTNTTAEELTEAIEAIEAALATAQDALATGVNGVAAATGNDVIYTIGGVRVSNMNTPGIYIVNGKKVLVK